MSKTRKTKNAYTDEDDDYASPKKKSKTTKGDESMSDYEEDESYGEYNSENESEEEYSDDDEYGKPTKKSRTRSGSTKQVPKTATNNNTNNNNNSSGLAPTPAPSNFNPAVPVFTRTNIPYLGTMGFPNMNPISTPIQQPKKTFTATQLKQRLLAVPHADLVSSVVSLVSSNQLDEGALIRALPVSSCDVYVEKLKKSANAISRALPHSRFGSQTDHYGYKRCSSAVTAFKKEWNDNVSVLSGGERATFLDYLVKALDILDRATDFDSSADNAYKTLCLKKLSAPVKKIGKEKNLTQQEQADYQKISKALEALEPKTTQSAPINTLSNIQTPFI